MSKMLGNVVLSIASVTMLFVMNDRAGAGYLFHDLVTEGEYARGNAWQVGAGHQPYVNFAAAETGNVSEVLAAIWQSGTDSVQLTLTDSSNQVLETWSGVAPYFTTTVPVWDLVSVNHPLLISGEVYTLTASYSGNVVVGWDYTGNSLHQAYPPLYFSTTYSGGVDVLDSSAVPEPSTFALLGLGALGLAVRAYQRRQSSVGSSIPTP